MLRIDSVIENAKRTVILQRQALTDDEEGTSLEAGGSDARGDDVTSTPRRAIATYRTLMDVAENLLQANEGRCS